MDNITHIIVAALAVLPATIAAVTAVWLSVRSNAKIDDNTRITKRAEIDTKHALNGGLTERLDSICKRIAAVETTLDHLAGDKKVLE